MDLIMETKKIEYTITFLSDWHAGSGLSSGAEADAVVIKDSNNLPYLPGKTIKGLVKDALKDIGNINEETINLLMGYEIKDSNNKTISTFPGTLFFSNAALEKQTEEEITKDMSHHLYRKIASTTIDENGIAKSGSLRTMEVCIPIELEGYVDGIQENEIKQLEKAFKYTRHIGVNRNRGLGRCQFKIKSK
jgi:CRISPR/Cas system CSM-associated protein Csm3 (group 7 of RAMP superfamily)